ncbi:polo-like kinase 1 [Fistulifera solaris]|uniref:Serine/threonine-protein kinase PLK n=1 Tax=Fistulifera solaris TaxID=1519565 RepID=A0A1Z5KHN0_FISSO|nr:polo-like kinase 1 [Fistulifera solaris]|eukprot:GAX25830.1 polo-like kinase 1 [Fistulifera solaris]
MSTALEIIDTIPPFRDSRSDSNKFPQTVYGGRSMVNASSQNRSNPQNHGMVMSGIYTSASSNAEEYSSSSQAYPLVISQGDVSSRGTRSTVDARNDTGSGFRNTVSSSLLRASEKTASSRTASSDDGSQDIMIEEKRRCPDGDGHTIHQYLRGRMLGKGGFAKVYLCTAMDTGKQYAVKVVAKSNLVKARARQKLQTEIKIHRTLKHRHICQYKHYFEDRSNCYILLELCHNQSLNEMIKRRKRLTEPEAAYFLNHLLDSVKFMHDNSVIHRDLKLGNLFLDRDMELKVGDFGLATRVEDGDEKRKTICGTPNYIAPEIIQGDKSKRGHSFEVDVWSIGVILYTMLVGKPPYEAKDVKATYQRILANEYSFPGALELSERVKDLIRCILQSDPKDRPSLETIMAHPFLNDSPLPQYLPSNLLHRVPVWQENEFGFLVCEGDAVSATSSKSSLPRFTSRHPFGARHPNMPKSTTSSVKPSKGDREGDSNRNLNTMFVPTKGMSSKKAAVPSEFQIYDESEPSEPKPKIVASPKPCAEATSDDVLVTRTASLSIASPAIQMSKAPSVSPKSPENRVMSADNDFDVVRNMVDQLDTVLAIANSRKGSYRAHSPQPGSSQNGPRKWVIRYVDYTSKYGLGFLLNDGGSGVYFNDSTKTALESEGDCFQYIERKRDEKNASTSRRPETTIDTYTLVSYPEFLKKKVTLLTHFRNYLIDQQKKAAEEHHDKVPLFFGSAKTVDGDLVYVKKWVQTKHAILFRLSDQTIQVVFYDQTEVLLTPDTRFVTYVDKNRVRATYCLTDDLVGTSSEIEKRLKYTRDIVSQLLAGQKS